MTSRDDAPDFSFPKDLYMVVARAFGTTIADAKQRILAAIYDRHGSSQTASTCRMGLPCEEHGGAVHGQEAEQLRAGVERIIRSTAMVSEDDAAFVLEASRRSLIFLLDSIDARDSLSFREMTDPPEVRELMFQALHTDKAKPS